MADKEEKEPERMDAPNQQAVGQPPPWEEGSGGKEGDPTAQIEETAADIMRIYQERIEPPRTSDVG